ncbi:MAG: hypothetical protein KTR25_17040 [Myxococcales bacterium]|nr:hypothetical protein [Myxococcales bacterium]
MSTPRRKPPPRKRKEIVLASDIAEFTFCAESLRLKDAGHKPNDRAQQRMAAGTARHRAWTQVNRSPTPARTISWMTIIIAILLLIGALYAVFSN